VRQSGAYPVTNISNTNPPHRRSLWKPESRCLVPANSFAVYAPEPNPQKFTGHELVRMYREVLNLRIASTATETLRSAGKQILSP
jgi:putative SOS response-associated peptidase YedK